MQNVVVVWKHIRLLLQMRQEGFKPDVHAYVSILNVTASKRSLKWVKEVPDYAYEAGLESDLRVGNALIHMYAKGGSIDDARLVFDRMVKRVFTWSVMINGLAQHRCGHEVYRLFLQMRQEGVEPNAITYTSILNASASEGALEWVKEVHGHAMKAGLESDLRMGNALVYMYAKSGNIDDAQLIYDRLKTRDVLAFNAMVGALAERGLGVEGYRLFLQMRREGVKPDAITYVSMLNAFASMGALEWVKDVHAHALAKRDWSWICVWALIHIYAKSGSIDDARLVFDRMEKRDVVTWTAMIGGLALHGFAHEALELFRKTKADDVNLHGASFVAVLSACCHGGLVGDGSRHLLALTRDYSIEPTVVHYMHRGSRAGWTLG